MIVRFTTRSGALTLHGEAALSLLRAMGHSGTVPGAILAADLPAALASLRGVLASPAAAATTVAPPDDPNAAHDVDDADEEREPPVTLRMRAVPFIDLLETAIAHDSDLMWERA